jgi:hypothetical protein
MTVLRVHRHKRDFTITANATPRNQRLSLRARGLLWFLLSQPDGYPVNAAELAAAMATAREVGAPAVKEGREAIETAVKELAFYGYLHRRREQNPRGQWITYTDVFEVPELACTDTDNGSPVVGERQPDNGSPVVGKIRRSAGKSAGPADNGSTDIGSPVAMDQGRTHKDNYQEPSPDPDGSASPDSALGKGLDPSPGSHGSPSPHGGGPPPSKTPQDGQQEQIFEIPSADHQHSKAVNAGSLVNEYVAGFEHERRPPKQHIGHIASQTKKLLDEGIAPERVRSGLALVRERGLPPSALPNAVVQAEALARSRNGRRSPTTGNGHHADPVEAERRAREFNARQAARRRAVTTTARGAQLAAEVAAKGANQ